MPNAVKKPEKSDIKTFIKTVSSKQVAQFLDILNIRDEISHQHAIDLVGDLMDVTGDDPENPLNRVIEVLADAIAHYEDKVYPIPVSSPVDIVRHLMEQHDLTQSELPEIGTQGVVSEILRGRRQLNTRQIQALSLRFNVSPALFFECR